MLFVDDDEAEVVKVGAFLDQRVGTDDQVELAAGHLFMDLLLARAARAARQQRHLDRPAECRGEAVVVPERLGSERLLTRK